MAIDHAGQPAPRLVRALAYGRGAGGGRADIRAAFRSAKSAVAAERGAASLASLQAHSFP